MFIDNLTKAFRLYLCLLMSILIYTYFQISVNIGWISVDVFQAFYFLMSHDLLFQFIFINALEFLSDASSEIGEFVLDVWFGFGLSILHIDKTEISRLELEKTNKQTVDKKTTVFSVLESAAISGDEPEWLDLLSLVMIACQKTTSRTLRNNDITH